MMAVLGNVIIEGKCCFFFLIQYLWWTSNCMSIFRKSEDASDDDIDRHSLEYLLKEGYLQLRANQSELSSRNSLKKAIKNFQWFVGINQTGTLDAETKDLMMKPRCSAFEPVIRKRRMRRYAIHGTRWKNINITWALENSNNDNISDERVREILSNAFDKWEGATKLNFNELVDQPDNSADIRIRFGTGLHKDCPHAFDGGGGTLAHAFNPGENKGLDGDIHFDDHEVFSDHSNAGNTGISLPWVALHEIGHSLGLNHSTKMGAIMYPFYENYYGDDYDLTHDDIAGIQTIYGMKHSPGFPNGTSKSPDKVGAIGCTNLIGAAFVDDDRKLNVINYDRLYILGEDTEGVESGPLPLSNRYDSLYYTDAAFRRHSDGFIVFFHGRQFTIFNDKNVFEKARYINDGFQNIDVKLESIDTAFIWPQNNKLYIFKGEYYWRMSQLKNHDYIADFGYPQLISSRWIGLPKTIDSAFVWSNNKTYFTRSNYYYRWDEKRQRVHSGYPQKLTKSFLKCINNSHFDDTGHAVNSGFTLKAKLSLHFIFLIAFLMWQIWF